MMNFHYIEENKIISYRQILRLSSAGAVVSVTVPLSPAPIWGLSPIAQGTLLYKKSYWGVVSLCSFWNTFIYWKRVFAVFLPPHFEGIHIVCITLYAWEWTSRPKYTEFLFFQFSGTHQVSLCLKLCDIIHQEPSPTSINV